MTEAQKRFCDEYLIDLNATRAYKVAYKNCKSDLTARTNGSKLLTNTNIQSYISKKQKEIEKRTEVTQDRVVQELAKIAFFNIKDIYNDNGTLKQIKDIDENTSKAIASIKTLQKAKGMKINVNLERADEEIPIEHIEEQTIEFKINDKVKALELLGKHLGMFNDVNVNMKNAIQVQLVDDVNE